MIRMLQCLCGPKRHCILGMLYDDTTAPGDEVRQKLEDLLEGAIAKGILNRRCEICDKSVIQFQYEDRVFQEQDPAAAQAMARVLEAEQLVTQAIAKAQRRADKN